MLTDIEELKMLIDRDSKLLQAELSMSVEGMLMGDLMENLKKISKLEIYLEKNLLKLESLKSLEQNNSELED